MKMRHYISLAIAALIIIGSFLLPDAVAGVTDMHRLNNLVLVDSQRISFDTAPELSLAERISLAANAGAEVLPLNTGSAMNSETAEERASAEIARFFRGGAFDFNYNYIQINEGVPSLIIDTMAPTNYMIVWEFDIIDDSGNSVTLILDDEIGVIVRLIYRIGNRDNAMITEGHFQSQDELFHTAARRLSEMMTAYYGVSVVLGDYQFSGSLSYYRLDITEGGLVIPMYGVVRATSFTINERV